jgi:hypothetical protein
VALPREAIELAIKCFSRALELTGMQDMVKRLGNVENMLGVFYTQQATALVHKNSSGC